MKKFSRTCGTTKVRKAPSELWILIVISFAAASLPNSANAITIATAIRDMDGNALGTIDVWSDGMVPAGVDTPSDQIGDGFSQEFIETGEAGTIFARFTHNRVSNDAAAEVAWGGHFAWVNKVVNEVGTGPVFDEDGNQVNDPNNPPNDPDDPYIDPLAGGGSIDEADRLPFYWDHKDADPMTPGFQGIPRDEADVDFGFGPDGIPEFIDMPADQADSMIEFETFLVAVPGNVAQMDDMFFHLLGGFRWKWHEGPVGFGEGDDGFISMLMPIEIAPANIRDLIEDVNTALNRSGFEQWRATSHIIPEPLTASLGLMGLGGLAMSLRRRPVTA